MPDPDVTGGSSDSQYVQDRLAYANGWTMEIVPDMLASYEFVDKQGLTTVLKLRPGIKTHNKAPVNGRLFNAKDVAYSIMRKAGKVDPKAAAIYPRLTQYVGLEKAEAVDDLTVRVTFGKPNGAFMHALCDPRASMLPIEQDTIGFKDPLKFVGTGAWILTEFKAGARAVFKANQEYYRSWDEGGRPGFDTYETAVIADRASTLAAYLSNQISYLSRPLPQEEPQIKSSSKDSLWYTAPGPTWDYLALNLTLPSGMFKDERVRKAIQLALDYKALADPLGRGWNYASITHPMFPEAYGPDEVAKMPGYNQSTKKQDVASAVQMMTAAGHPQGAGLKWELDAGTGQVSDTGVRLKDMLTEIWPKLEMSLFATPDSATHYSRETKKEYDAEQGNHTSVPDAAIDIATYFYTDGGRNYTGYSQAWADAIFDKMLVSQNLEERRTLLRGFLDRYFKEGPDMILLRNPPDAYVVQGNVAGYDMVTGPWAYQSYGVSPRWAWQTEK